MPLRFLSVVLSRIGSNYPISEETVKRKRNARESKTNGEKMKREGREREESEERESGKKSKTKGKEKGVKEDRSGRGIERWDTA